MRRALSLVVIAAGAMALTLGVATPASANHEAAVMPASGGKKVGIGTPFVLELPFAVTGEKVRQQVADATVVTVNGEAVSGHWWWPKKNTARFVPAEYWPGDAEVKLSVNFDAVNTKRGEVQGTLSTQMRTGKSVSAVVKGKKQKMVVYEDGEKVRVVKVSTGKPGRETRVGVKLIMTRHDGYVMNGPPDDPYTIPVNHAMRITATGEMIHSAPWATHRLGVRPGSKGCTNVSNTDAKWLYENVKVGTPVLFKNTGGEVTDPSNGLGDWNIDRSKAYLVDPLRTLGPL